MLNCSMCMIGLSYYFLLISLNILSHMFNFKLTCLCLRWSYIIVHQQPGALVFLNIITKLVNVLQAQEYLKVCKGKWLQCHIPYLELQDLLMDHQLRLVESTPCSNTQVSFMIIGSCLSHA